MNGKKARALRKYARAKALEYLQNKDTYESARQHFDGLTRKIYQAAKTGYKKVPKNHKRNG